MVIIEIIVLLSSLTVYSIKKEKTNQLVTILVISLLLLGSTFVKAQEDNFVISVKDSTGKGLSNVKVKVYATPRVEASPAIKISANGGEFADGRSLIYYRIPFNGCTITDIKNVDHTGGALAILSGSTKFAMMRFLLTDAVKEGHKLVSSPLDDNSSLNYYNGTVYELEWNEDPSAEIITIDGNGGSINTKYFTMTKRKIYKDESMILNNNRFYFNNNDLIFIGNDNNKNCTNYEYGYPKSIIDYSSNYLYSCWDDNPDGLYVYLGSNEPIDSSNHFIYVKSKLDNVANKSAFNYEYESDSLDFSTYASIPYANFRPKQTGIYIAYPMISFVNVSSQDNLSFLITNVASVYIPIIELKIIENGEILVDVQEDEITTYQDNENKTISRISDINKNTIVFNYINSIVDYLPDNT